MDASKDIFRAYDIRGVYGTELDAEIGEQIGLVFGNPMQKKSKKNEDTLKKDIELKMKNGEIVILHPDRTWEFKEIDIMDMGRDVLKLQNGAVYQGVYKSKDEKSVTFHVDGYNKPQTLPLS